MLKEWPLVAFTIAGQTAVGIGLLVLLPLSLAAGILGNVRSRQVLLVVTAVILGLLVVAAVLSFFHLSHPFRARHVLSNLRTSWLSREIFFELAYMALVGLALVLVATETTEGLLFRAVAGAAALSGILFLVSMSKLYMLASVPPWASPYTGISFFITALTLGAMTTVWITGSPAGDPSSYLSRLWTASLFFLAGDIFFAALLAPQYGVAGLRLGPSLRPLPRVPRLLHRGRLALLAGGLLIMALAIVTNIPGAAGGSSSWPVMTLAFVLVLLGEIAGRFFFYGLVPRIGD